MTGFFITATGTEVGKTLVGEVLCRQLVEQGAAVHILKPIISGYDPADLAASDTGRLLRALSQDVTKEAVEALTPWRFEAAMSPDMAAAREGRHIDFRELVTYCRTEMTEHGDKTVLIEGAGGAFVPLDAEYLTVDWIAALGISAIVVAGSYLGTISHTLATVEGLKRRNVEVAGIVVSESEEQPVPLAETCEALRRYVGDIGVFSLPRLTNLDEPWCGAKSLVDLIQ